jgi:hypothetical protein
MSQTIEVVPFAGDLRSHGDRLAVVAPDGGELTYRELAERVSDAADELGPERRLVHVNGVNEVEPLVRYLAALQRGYPVLLAPDDSLVQRYQSARSLHPELAVLLPTSGSTGSPKLVRLSVRNLQANAAAIADYLDIRDTDRASAALPMHYCYGLSVINSNLLSGAGLLLTSNSVVDECFWDRFRRCRATSLHGVPYTFEVLDELGFEQMDLPGLRYVTQAGGRLAPERVRRYAEMGERRGWRFFVMYGQTEATARMAYLPPELARANPAAIGVPIPGGSLDLAPDGELIYRGPNVMLGYAERPEDLALGRTVGALPTGDIGRRNPAGLLEIVGRKSRFAKLFGLRIDLQDIERLLTTHGFAAACAGTDSLMIATTSPDNGRAREIVLARTGLPSSSVHVIQVRELPRLPNGKVDYEAVRRLEVPPEPEAHGVREAFTKVLNRQDIPDSATFVSLGGDSLSYVQMSIELEMVLGRVPHGWHTMPVRHLERLRPRRSALRLVETDIVLRAIAITLVVVTHVGLIGILGGAHLLLVIAGWSFARFALAQSRPAPRILVQVGRIAVPAVVWLTFRLFVSDNVTFANVLLVNNYVSGGAWGYWFVEVLVQTLLVMAVVFAIPGVARFERRHGFGVALTALLLALVLFAGIESTGVFPEWGLSTHGVLWFFMLGWLVQRATTGVRKCVVLVAAFLLIPDFLGHPLREIVVLAGVLLLMLVPRMVVPRSFVRPIGLVASASLYIYLTHYVVYSELLLVLPALPVTVITLAVGIVAWRVGECTWRSFQRVRCGSRVPDAYTAI